ncbi:hypothetical protein SE11_22685, partial [Salmonella enterica subsp. enterica serovar Braenderup]
VLYPVVEDRILQAQPPLADALHYMAAGVGVTDGFASFLFRPIALVFGAALSLIHLWRRTTIILFVTCIKQPNKCLDYNLC